MSAKADGIVQTSTKKIEKLNADFQAWVDLDSTNLSPGQQLAVKYFSVAVILFVFSNFIWLAGRSTIYLSRISL